LGSFAALNLPPCGCIRHRHPPAVSWKRSKSSGSMATLQRGVAINPPTLTIVGTKTHSSPSIPALMQ